jgi:chorismate dehydratase
MRVGYIDYLNTYPLYWKLFDHPENFKDVDIVSGTPKTLNHMVRKGALDLSPVSVACLPEIQDDVHVLSDYCLGANGAVRSVLLLSDRPIEQLDDALIGLTSASETSIVLLRYLVEVRYGIRPRYIDSDQNKSDKNEAPAAILLIGNEALSVNRGPYSYVYDLADLWFEQMHVPFVFAVFVVRRDVVESLPHLISKIRRGYADSLFSARSDKASFVLRAAQAYPFVETDLQAYFESMKYDFTDVFKAGLQCYFEEAAKAGLLRPVKELSYV